MSYMRAMICLSLILGFVGFNTLAVSPQEKLFLAAQACTFSDVRALSDLKDALQEGAELEAMDSSGRTALHMAAENGRARCLEALLERGAQVETEDPLKKTALHRAAEKGSLDCLKALLEKGAQVESKDYVSKTALHRAAEKGNLDCVKALLNKAAHVEAKDIHNSMPVHCAIENGHVEVLRELLLVGAGICLGGTNDNIVERMRNLLTRIHDVRPAESLMGHLPENKRTELAKLCDPSLVARNFCFEIPEVVSPTVELLEGVHRGLLPLVERALANGAELEAKDSAGKTALETAARMGDLPCVKALLKKGAHVEVDDVSGHSALYYAVKRGDKECLRALLIASLGSFEGKAPDDLAEKMRIILTKIKSAGPILQVLNQLSSQKRYEIENLLNPTLVEENFRYDIPGVKTPNEALIIAVQIGSIPLLKKALAKGASTGVTSSWRKMNVLHIAADVGKADCLDILLKHGAYVQSTAEDGKAPLYFAARSNHVGAVRVLLAHGADIEEVNVYSGKTAVHRAAEGRHIESLKALLLGGGKIIIDGEACSVIAQQRYEVKLSRRRLKVALLALRYAGASSDGPKSTNTAGDSIVSSDYVRSWLLLSHSDLRKDVFNVLMDALAHGKKVDYPLFRLAANELGDYLVAKLESMLKRLHKPHLIGLIGDHAEIAKLCNPDLVQVNFGTLIRSGIKARFNELLKTNDFQGITSSSQNSSSSSSTSSVKEPSIKCTSR